MQADLNLSTEIRHRPTRPPDQAPGKPQGRKPHPTGPFINTSLVLDRSGSMSGEPLHAAKDAAMQFVQYLGAQDLISVEAKGRSKCTRCGMTWGSEEVEVKAVAKEPLPGRPH